MSSQFFTVQFEKAVLAFYGASGKKVEVINMFGTEGYLVKVDNLVHRSETFDEMLSYIHGLADGYELAEEAKK